jgi:hypothetical protein
MTEAKESRKSSHPDDTTPDTRRLTAAEIFQAAIENARDVTNFAKNLAGDLSVRTLSRLRRRSAVLWQERFPLPPFGRLRSLRARFRCRR